MIRKSRLDQIAIVHFARCVLWTLTFLMEVLRDVFIVFKSDCLSSYIQFTLCTNCCSGFVPPIVHDIVRIQLFCIFSFSGFSVSKNTSVSGAPA